MRKIEDLIATKVFLVTRNAPVPETRISQEAYDIRVICIAANSTLAKAAVEQDKAEDLATQVADAVAAGDAEDDIPKTWLELHGYENEEQVGTFLHEGRGLMVPVGTGTYYSITEYTLVEYCEQLPHPYDQ